MSIGSGQQCAFNGMGAKKGKDTAARQGEKMMPRVVQDYYEYSIAVWYGYCVHERDIPATINGINRASNPSMPPLVSTGSPS